MTDHEKLDIEAIMRQLPHRYPFLLVDRVLECVSGKHVHALPTRSNTLVASTFTR